MTSDSCCVNTDSFSWPCREAAHGSTAVKVVFIGFSAGNARQRTSLGFDKQHIFIRFYMSVKSTAVPGWSVMAAVAVVPQRGEKEGKCFRCVCSFFFLSRSALFPWCRMLTGRRLNLHRVHSKEQENFRNFEYLGVGGGLICCVK